LGERRQWLRRRQLGGSNLIEDHGLGFTLDWALGVVQQNDEVAGVMKPW
jgi:hypothetical protein